MQNESAEESRRAYEQAFPRLKWRRRRKEWPPIIAALLVAGGIVWLLSLHLRWVP